MALWWISGVLVLAIEPADAMTLYDPKLCYILDGFLSLYGLVITAMFIKEKFFKTKADGAYTGGSSQQRGDLERGRGLTKRPEDEYKELPVKRERPRKNDLVYQGLSRATRDTYDSIQMQPFSSR